MDGQGSRYPSTVPLFPLVSAVYAHASWGPSFVEIEQCPRCRTMLLDAGELPRVFVIEHSAKP